MIDAAVIAILVECSDDGHGGDVDFLAQGAHRGDAFASQTLNDTRFLPCKFHTQAIRYSM